jgi:nickel/cobalt exporter
MMNTLNAFYFPSAVALGALHALEPGHAKALTAAYLIGIKGTKKDSMILGLSVAATHSIVVIGISAIGLWLGREAFAGRATHWLEMGSGLVAIAIGSWMLWRRLSLRYKIKNGVAHNSLHQIANKPMPGMMTFKNMSQAQSGRRLIDMNRKPAAHPDHHSHSEHDDDHSHHDHDHAHLDDVAHAQAHAATLPHYVRSGKRPSLLQIALFGAAGGMIPCPASITVMLLALSTGRTGMGLFTVLGFSLGLALSLVGIGMIVVTGLSQLSHAGRFSQVSRNAPIVSAILVIASGMFALVIAH